MTTGQTSNQVWRGQNQEDQIVAEYFGQYVGNLLSVGENNGIDLSNCRALIENGWKGILVEPSPKAFLSLFTLYYENPKVWCFNAAIADYNGKSVFYESGEHLGMGDVALLSTLNKNELKRWKGTTNTFEETEVLVWDFNELQNNVRHHSCGKSDKYDFINLDAEGFDLIILKQMDLTLLGCKVICVEHNSNGAVLSEIIEYCGLFGLKNRIGYNGENIILAL